VIDGTSGVGTVIDLGTGTKYVSGTLKNERVFAVSDVGVSDVWDSLPPADTVTPDATYSATSVPALLGNVAKIDSNYFGSASGLTLLEEVEADKATGATSFITSSFATGMMRGDIKTCLMSDTEAGDATGTIPDRSVAGNDATITGTLTKSAVATGAELMAFGGFSASNYAEADRPDFADTHYLTGWVNDGGWQFKHGVASSNPIEGVTITGTVLHIEGTLNKALIRVSATTPTAEQIKADYLAELPMFQENARCTLSGASDNCLAVSYDSDTDEAVVLTDVVDTFQGLINIKQAALTGTASCTDSGNGVVAIGTTTQASVEKPEMNIREELAKII